LRESKANAPLDIEDMAFCVGCQKLP